MIFYIKVKKIFWKQLRFPIEILEQLKKLLEADNVELMTEFKTRFELIKSNDCPLIEMHCATCKSFVLAPYGMKSYCRKSKDFVEIDHLPCLNWRPGKQVIEKQIFDFQSYKNKKEADNEGNV